MANTFDPYVPQWWAATTLALLNESLVAMPLVNTDYGAEFARGGQVINTRRPSKLTAQRKDMTDSLTKSDLSATNVAIPLNQHVYQNFGVYDLEQQRSMTDLINEYIQPAAFGLAKMADAVVLSQMFRSILTNNVTGTPSQKTYENFVDARTKMDTNLAYADGRNLILSPSIENKLLKDQVLYKVNESGSNSALRAGEVGELAGFSLFKTQNLNSPTLSTGASHVQTITVTATALAGSSTLVFTNPTVNIVAGDWLLVDGRPYKVLSFTGTTTLTATLDRPLEYGATVSSKVYNVLKKTTTTAYAAGWQKPLVLTGSGSYAVGDIVDIGGFLYGVIGVPAANTVLLDRPLEAAVTSGGDVKGIPANQYGFAFHRDYMTVVARPLAPTDEKLGIRSAVVTAENGLSVRAQMWYNGSTQETQVSLDFLMGVQVLDSNLACLIVP